MPECTIKNTGDIPLAVTDPDTGEVYSILPGYTLKVKLEWPTVKEALAQGRAQIVSTGRRGE